MKNCFKFIHKFLVLFNFFIISLIIELVKTLKIINLFYSYFLAVKQLYEVHVYDDYVIKGNTGVSHI